jgi:hypothetical protein
MMFTGQLSWTDATDRAAQLALRANVVKGDGSGAAFTLLFTEVLAITEEFGDETGQPGSADFGNYGRPWLASGPALGSRLPSPSSAKFTAPNLAVGLNRAKLANWMDAHALAYSSHHCAMFCRLGMEAAGMNTADRPLSGDAADYGPFLLRHGAHVVPSSSYTPQVGDTVIFDKIAEHPNGHIEMYDGHHWVSDFMQHSFSPYRDAASTPSFTIYRLT